MGGREAVDGLPVAVSKVVAVAGLVEAPAERVLGRRGAPVRGPDEPRGCLEGPVGQEAGQADLEHEPLALVHLFDVGLALFDHAGRLGSGHGHDHARREGEEAGDDGELHCCDVGGVGVERRALRMAVLSGE